MIRKRIQILLICLLSAMLSVAAQRSRAMAVPSYTSSALTHWVGLSLIGVEANLLPAGEQIRIKAGYGGSARLQYELRKKGWFFNIGVGADFVLTNTYMQTYTDAFARVDFTGEALYYRYNYSDYSEQQRQLRLIIPLQAGYQFGEWVYVGVGASFRLAPLLNQTATTTRMYTQGEYERFIEPIRNAPQYGFWSEAEYSGTGIVRSAGNEVAVEAEVGVNIPMPVKWVSMRAGLYAGYDLPIGAYADRERTSLVDYSAVDIYPTSQSQENLQANIRFNSMLDAPLAVKEAQRLRVGLKLTLLFDVTPKPKNCMCWK